MTAPKVPKVLSYECGVCGLPIKTFSGAPGIRIYGCQKCRKGFDIKKDHPLLRLDDVVAWIESNCCGGSQAMCEHHECGPILDLAAELREGCK